MAFPREFGRSLALLVLVSACAAPAVESRSPVARWIAEAAVPAKPKSSKFERFCATLDGVRVIGLGEATHGQRESFELKRELTLHFVREHGVRLIAYEATATRARATEAYVQGESDDLDAAVKGLGMLIWAIEENATFLRELREWNLDVEPAERAHFVGIDVQDPSAAVERLAELVPDEAEALAEARSIAAELGAAVSKLWSGEIEDYESLATRTGALVDRLGARADLPSEARVRLTEFRLGVEMFRSPGGRDLALAKMLLAELDAAGPGTRAVVWAHNGHVTRAPLSYLASDELAMGGHLGAALGEGYYALGFLFGEGEFQANDRDEAGAWGFRRYRIGPPPSGALEAPFVEADRGDCVVDLRGAPKSGAVAQWLETGHGQRWFGGYNVAPDYAEAASDVNRLLPTTPRADYDGLAFLARTTAATPRDPTRIFPPK
ncbi:MAG: erythromycin esterase family protein [Planctomycetes bacterium]|nr:erythromycin esterase family protein [Planctomycetota bacterium]